MNLHIAITLGDTTMWSFYDYAHTAKKQIL